MSNDDLINKIKSGKHKVALLGKTAKLILLEKKYDTRKEKEKTLRRTAALHARDKLIISSFLEGKA